jgi:hypothetical protein
MSAGSNYEYYWADGDKIKKPKKCSAPDYVDYLMTWVQNILDDENIFPSRVGRVKPFAVFFFFVMVSYFLFARCSISS